MEELEMTLLEAEDKMDKAIQAFKRELRECCLYELHS